MDKNRIIIYGFGNPGRQDDGLGPAIISKLESEQVSGINTDSNYQLNVEDALEISGFKIAIFVDASVSVEEPFAFYEIVPSSEITFTTHSMSPQSVLALCNDLYHTKVKAFILEVRGYGWEFEDGLTQEAEKNCEEAFSFLKNKIGELLQNKDNIYIN